MFILYIENFRPSAIDITANACSHARLQLIDNEAEREMSAKKKEIIALGSQTTLVM